MKSKFWKNKKNTWRYSFLSFWTAFCPFNNPKNQNFVKITKHPWDIIIVHMCNINDNHVMYRSWDKERDGHNFSLFWTIFCTFTPLTTRKIKILKKWKKLLEILSFYTCVPYVTIIWCMVSETSSMTDIIFCHFGPFFALLPSKHLKNQNFEKMKKTPADITILHKCTKSHVILIFYFGLVNTELFGEIYNAWLGEISWK